MTNTTSKGPWAIKNAVIPVDTDTEAFEIERAAARLGADADGYDLDADDHIIGVSVTGPAETIDALVKLFTADDVFPDTARRNQADEIAPLVIPTIDYFQVFEMINALSASEGNGAAIVAIERWLEENAVAAATNYARAGRPDDAAAILDIYDGEADPDAWADVISEIDRARAEQTPEERDDDPDDATEEAADFDAMVQAWRDDPAHENIDAALEANATDTTNEPRNLYRAGVFAGLAEAAAWMIYEGVTTDDADDINAITAAIYKAYRVAW